MATDVSPATIAFVSHVPEFDVETAKFEIKASRRNKDKIINVLPQSAEPWMTIDYCLSEIQSGERIRITLPRYFTHRKQRQVIDWEAVNDLYQDYIGDTKISDDIFFTLRSKRETDPVIFDLYRV